MKRYGTLLRGINISGKNKVVMAELKKEIENLEMGYVYFHYFYVVPALNYVRKLHQNTENLMSYLCMSQIKKEITANVE